jgi:hypothetical protein
MQRTDTIPASHLAAILAAAMQDSDVYEAYSEPERKLRSFPTLDRLLEYVDSKHKAGERHVALSVYFRDTKGAVETRRISLRPEKNGGATWREAVNGWGLVQVQFKFLQDGLVECRIAANSEKRAVAWASNHPAVDAPGLWDWKLVEKHVRRLIRVLRQGERPTGAG